MEEKERYELFGEFGIIHDTSPNAECMLLNKFQTCEILNKQDKENQQLKQSQKQLAIGELRRIKEYILINDKYDEEVGCNIIETFDLLEDIRDRIEELSGGENE